MKQLLKIPLTTAVILAVVLFFFERALSRIIVVYLQTHTGVLEFGNFLALKLFRNADLVFSIPAPRGFIIGISVIIFLICTAIFFLEVRLPTHPLIIGYSLIAAGSVSNLLSRVMNGFVWDYVAIRVAWEGAWNLADCYIILGICLWIYAFISPNNSIRTTSKPSTD
ncbi:MAG TPA: signal peptidase II [Patescibacteria group bacterium]|nr:signal peptidase II [Patescibacteria group bacterium]